MPRYDIKDGLRALNDSVSTLNQAQTSSDALKAFPTILAMGRLAATRGTPEPSSSTAHLAMERMGDILSSLHKRAYSGEIKLVNQMLAAVSEILKPTPAKTDSKPLVVSKPLTGKTETPSVEPSTHKPKPK